MTGARRYASRGCRVSWWEWSSQKSPKTWRGCVASAAVPRLETPAACPTQASHAHSGSQKLLCESKPKPEALLPTLLHWLLRGDSSLHLCGECSCPSFHGGKARTPSHPYKDFGTNCTAIRQYAAIHGVKKSTNPGSTQTALALLRASSRASCCTGLENIRNHTNTSCWSWACHSHKEPQEGASIDTPAPREVPACDWH